MNSLLCQCWWSVETVSLYLEAATKPSEVHEGKCYK